MLLRLAQNTYNPLLMPRCASFAVLIVLLCVSLTSIAAPAPRAQFGKIKGTVVDMNEARIVTAEVAIVGGVLSWRVRTDTNGEFEMSLPVGEYQFSIDAPGFETVPARHFEIKKSRTYRVEVKMREAKPKARLVPAGPQFD
jgi:carboxypeptidase family protein